MSSRREFELLLTLRGALGSDFSTSFRGARNELNALRTAMSSTNSTMRDISAYQRQQQAIKDNEARLVELQARHRELQEAMDSTTTPSESLRRQFEHNEQQIRSLCDRIGDQQRELRELGDRLHDAGVNTDDLAGSTAALRAQYEHLADCRRRVQEINEEFDTNRQKLQESTAQLGKMVASYTAVAAAAYAATVKPSIAFESAYTGVLKTVEGTDKQLADIRQGLLNLSETKVTASAKDIAAVAEAAGQLGIQTENVVEFARVMVNLGDSTNLAAEDAASQLAKFANITKMDQSEFSRLGSVIVDLGNNFATTEADIVAMGTRLASTGELTGLTEPEIMAFATALSSLGIEAEAGGTAASKFLKSFEVAYATGNMKKYAEVAGMTEKAFSKLYSSDKLGAISAFTKGLTDTERNGKSAIEILNDMDIKEVRYSNAVLALAASDDILTKATERANKAWVENTALTTEAQKRYETTESRIQLAKNATENLGIALGDLATPFIRDLADDFTELAMRARRYVEENGDTIISFVQTGIKVAELALALKALKTVYLRLKGGILLASKAVATFTTIVATAKTMSGGLTFKNLIKAFSSVTGVAFSSAAALAGVAAGLIAVGVAFKIADDKHRESVKEFMDTSLFENGGQKLSELVEEFQNATSESKKFADEIVATNSVHEENASKIAKSKSEIFLYNAELKETGKLSKDAAEQLKQPFEDLATALKDDFSVSYSNVFSAFSRDAKMAAEDLGVEVSQISGILDAFNKKYNSVVDSTTGEITSFLNKTTEGGEITQEDIDNYLENVKFLSGLSEIREGKIKSTDLENAASRISFEGNTEVAISSVKDFADYIKEYTTSLTEAQKNLQGEFQKARDEAKYFYEHGKLSEEEYKTLSGALSQAEAITQISYEEKMAYADKVAKETSEKISNQIQQAAEAAVAEKGVSFKNQWGGIFASWGNDKNAGENAYYAQVAENLKQYEDLSKAAGDLRTSTEKPIKVSVDAADALEELRKVKAAKDALGDSGTDVSVTTKGYASGTNYAESGVRLVGEEGPELMMFRGGERVYNADETADLLSDYRQVVMFLPQMAAALSAAGSVPSAPSAPSAPAYSYSSGGNTYTITVQSTYQGSVGNPADMDEYGTEIAEKVAQIIEAREKDERRNAYF